MVDGGSDMSGIFGIVSKGDCAETLLYGTDYHSHLGTEYGGLAVLGETFDRRIKDISQGQLKAKFFDDILTMKGNKGIGVVSAFDEQPIYINSKFGPFCIVTNGFIDNADELADGLMEKGRTFSEVGGKPVNQTELIAKLITEGNDLIDGMQKMFASLDGACSLLLLHKDGIYCATDKYGYWPLVIAQHGDEWAVTSETTAFPNIDFEVKMHLTHGEIILLNEEGIQTRKEGEEDSQICSFLWIYTGFPASNYEWINVELVRERCGAFLARKDKDINIDLVSGIPDSGVAHAIGYAMESGVPYRRPLIKYTPGYGRSYTPPTQATRDLIARMKLVPIKEVIKDKSILICEDSIVRGTQLKNFTVKKLWDRGAKEVHVRPACPPLMYPCKFNLSTRSIEELAARKAIRSIEGEDIEDVSEYIDHNSEKYKKMVDWIAKDLRVTTLRYQTVDDMVEAIGLPSERLCLYCWTGKYPKKGS
jgi:amidophosphoribosyltransferase